MAEKLCPKCGAKLLKSPSNFFLPASLPSQRKFKVADVFPERGMMVKAFACSKCDYVEFYAVKSE